MKVRILSDLHLEFFNWTPPAADADVVVLAGDIHVGTQALRWARLHFPETPIVYVPGNHEFYGEQMQHVMARLREEGAKLDINVLDADEVDVHGTRFLGATLWTAADPARPRSGPEGHARLPLHSLSRWQAVPSRRLARDSSRAG
jgi:Icc-related predicted phosphoesterase